MDQVENEFAPPILEGEFGAPLTAAMAVSGDVSVASVPLATYEQRLQSNPRWAMSEGSRHFDEKSAVFSALRNIAQRLSDLNIPYSIVGGMALFRHGFLRFTEVIDILVTRDSLQKIHGNLEGLGYLPPHKYSKHLRDTENRVRIEFLTTGDFPGDGRPKLVSFPDPSVVSFDAEGISYIKLAPLIELKLASGMTNVGRLKDLADVLELIKILRLMPDFAMELNPYVRSKFLELMDQSKTRYIMVWQRNLLTDITLPSIETYFGKRTVEELFHEMLRDGVILEAGGIEQGFARLVTTDPEIARKYEMLDETEFWEDQRN